MDELKKEFVKRQSGADGEQFLYMHLEKLLKKDSVYKANFLRDAKSELGGMDVSPEHIEDYFNKGYSLVFNLQHEEEYDSNTREIFYGKANQFALNKFREWLGFQQKT